MLDVDLLDITLSLHVRLSLLFKLIEGSFDLLNLVINFACCQHSWLFHGPSNVKTVKLSSGRNDSVW